jgi:hypothetical protein
MRRFMVLLVAPALLIGFTATAARSSELTGTDPNPSIKPYVPVTKYIRPPHNAMRVSLDVLVNGQPARVISHNGKLYLPVPRMGSEYEIRVNNMGSHRIAAIVSVDGLSVIKGDVASERSPGYLVDPRGNVVIKGWRRDKDTVAAFNFEERSNSYAYSRGYRDNIGVIGLVAIEEQTYVPRPLAEFYRGATAIPKSSADLLGGTGTGWGRDIGSSATLVPFVRSANKQMITIYYDTAEALRRIGVPVDGDCLKPFPADTGFCPPPTKSIR